MATGETDATMIDNRRRLAIQLITFARFKASGGIVAKPKASYKPRKHKVPPIHE